MYKKSDALITLLQVSLHSGWFATILFLSERVEYSSTIHGKGETLCPKFHPGSHF
jgi:hypothetical protein